MPDNRITKAGGKAAIPDRQLQQAQSLWSMSPEQRLYRIALAQPTLCGGGAFSYAGKEVSAGVGHAFQGTIVEHDSRTGTQVGLLTEAAVGEGAVIGGGSIQGLENTEPIAFAGGGVDAVFGEAGGGVVFAPESVGAYAEVRLGTIAVGAGGYANITTNAGCIRK